MIHQSHSSMSTTSTQSMDKLHHCPKQQHQPLSNMHIYRQEHHQKFNQKLTPVLLAQLGYQQNFPRDTVFGTKYSGGIGFLHYGAAQLRDKIIKTIQHIRAKTGKKFLVLVR
eukprot:12707160-Ditylum_brightwellii.AAC.1